MITAATTSLSLAQVAAELLPPKVVIAGPAPVVGLPIDRCTELTSATPRAQSSPSRRTARQDRRERGTAPRPAEGSRDYVYVCSVTRLSSRSAPTFTRAAAALKQVA